MKTKVIFISIFIITLTSCAKVFYSSNAYTLAEQQKIIAIIPPEVSIPASKNVSAEALQQQEMTESLNFQKEMYAYLLKLKMKGKMTQEIQDVITTNARLKKAGYPETPLTTAELCDVLGVDGVMTSNFALSKPVSTGAAIAVGVLFGASVATNEAKASISVSDCNSKTLIYNYDHQIQGSLGSSASAMVNSLMNGASKKLPYIKK